MRVVGSTIQRHIELAKEIDDVFVARKGLTLTFEADAGTRDRPVLNGMSRRMPQAPEPCSETQGQRCSCSQRRTGVVEHPVEEGQPNGYSGTSQDAAQHPAAADLFSAMRSHNQLSILRLRLRL